MIGHTDALVMSVEIWLMRSPDLLQTFKSFDYRLQIGQFLVSWDWTDCGHWS